MKIERKIAGMNFYIIYMICENIDIALYMYMFLWN